MRARPVLCMPKLQLTVARIYFILQVQQMFNIPPNLTYMISTTLMDCPPHLIRLDLDSDFLLFSTNKQLGP